MFGPKWFQPRTDLQPWNDHQIEPEMIPSPEWGLAHWKPTSLEKIGTPFLKLFAIAFELYTIHSILLYRELQKIQAFSHIKIRRN